MILISMMCIFLTFIHIWPDQEQIEYILSILKNLSSMKNTLLGIFLTHVLFENINILFNLLSIKRFSS